MLDCLAMALDLADLSVGPTPWGVRVGRLAAPSVLAQSFHAPCRGALSVADNGISIIKGPALLD